MRCPSLTSSWHNSVITKVSSCRDSLIDAVLFSRLAYPSVPGQPPSLAHCRYHVLGNLVSVVSARRLALQSLGEIILCRFNPSLSFLDRRLDSAFNPIGFGALRFHHDLCMWTGPCCWASRKFLLSAPSSAPFIACRLDSSNARSSRRRSRGSLTYKAFSSIWRSGEALSTPEI